VIDKKLLGYFLRAGLAFICWFVIYTYILQPYGFDSWLNEFVALCGHILVGWLGYESCIEGTSICVNIVSTVYIATGCNGFDIISIFLCFLVIFEGVWWHKLIYGVIVTVILHLFNVVRVAMLAIDRYENLRLFNFNHKYTYLILMYMLVFLFWYIWLYKFSRKK
jgi:exosortase/archaeosortase family protein